MSSGWLFSMPMTRKSTQLRSAEVGMPDGCRAEVSFIAGMIIDAFADRQPLRRLPITGACGAKVMAVQLIEWLRFRRRYRVLRLMPRRRAASDIFPPDEMTAWSIIESDKTRRFSVVGSARWRGFW